MARVNGAQIFTPRSIVTVIIVVLTQTKHPQALQAEGAKGPLDPKIMVSAFFTAFEDFVS